jgi:hypothetical protein
VVPVTDIGKVPLVGIVQPEEVILILVPKAVAFWKNAPTHGCFWVE